MVKLIDFVDVIRSKNAGPFHITFDIFIKDNQRYHHFKAHNPITKELISELYKVKIDDVYLMYMDEAQGFKVTIPRVHSCGCAEDSDVYGAQQHAPLIYLTIPDMA